VTWSQLVWPAQLGVLLAVGALLPVSRPLRLDVRVDGRIVWSGLVQKGDGFELAFEHSAEHCTWTDQFVVDGATIRQVATHFPCVGAGMPVGHALEWSSTNGLTAAVSQLLPALRIMNWRASRIRLLHRGQTVHIGQFAADFQGIEVSIGQ
jgi:hypothetical protein